MPAETLQREVSPQEVVPLSKRRARRIVKKAERAVRTAEKVQEIHRQSFPDEEARLAVYDSFLEKVRNNNSLSLGQAIKFVRQWNSDPSFVNRGVEKRIRDAARERGDDVPPLKKYRFASVKTCLRIMGQGQIPATTREANRAIAEDAGRRTKKNLTRLHDQLQISEKTKGRHASGFVLFAGGTYGNGAVNAGPNGGVVFEPRDPETKRRKHDAFISIKGKVVFPGRGAVLGARKHGVEKFYSAFGLTYSSGHPYRDEQVRMKFPLVETNFGKLSGATHEAPLLFYAPLANALGFPDVANWIYSLGFPNYYFARPHLGLDVQDERLRPIQETIAKYSAKAHVRLEDIKEKLPKRKKNLDAASGPTEINPQ